MKNSKHLNMIIEKYNRTCNIQVVFTDIEKYSKRRIEKQISIVDSFTQCISKAIEKTSHTFLKYSQENNINFLNDTIVLPTGDGAAIIFAFNGLNDIHLCFSMALLEEIYNINMINKCEIFEKNGWCDCHDYFNLRIGISEGKAILFKDINEQYNVAGSVVNMAARVMGLLDRNQIGFTEEAYRSYIEFSENKEILENFEVFQDLNIKHDTEINMFQYKDKTCPFLNSDIPQYVVDEATRQQKTSDQILPKEMAMAGIKKIHTDKNAPIHDLTQILENKNRIGFLGIAFSNIIPVLCTSIHRMILKNRMCEPDFLFEIFFLRPFSDSSEMRRRELRFMDPSTNIARNARLINEFKESILQEISEDLRETAQIKFRIFFYNTMPKQAVTRIDDDLYISPYFIREKGAESNFFMHLSPPGYLYEKYLRYYDDIANQHSKPYEKVKLIDKNICPHATKCKNFKIFSRQECDNCQETITGHHLHDIINCFRLCEQCAIHIIQGGYENYRPKFANIHENKICLNYEQCLEDTGFTMLTEKLCEKCNKHCDIHFHDVVNNIRLCLACFEAENILPVQKRH